MYTVARDVLQRARGGRAGDPMYGVGRRATAASPQRKASQCRAPRPSPTLPPRLPLTSEKIRVLRFERQEECKIERVIAYSLKMTQRTLQIRSPSLAQYPPTYLTCGFLNLFIYLMYYLASITEVFYSLCHFTNDGVGRSLLRSQQSACGSADGQSIL